MKSGPAFHIIRNQRSKVKGTTNLAMNKVKTPPLSQMLFYAALLMHVKDHHTTNTEIEPFSLDWFPIDRKHTEGNGCVHPQHQVFKFNRVLPIFRSTTANVSYRAYGTVYQVLVLGANQWFLPVSHGWWHIGLTRKDTKRNTNIMRSSMEPALIRYFTK